MENIEQHYYYHRITELKQSLIISLVCNIILKPFLLIGCASKIGPRWDPDMFLRLMSRKLSHYIHFLNPHIRNQREHKSADCKNPSAKTRAKDSASAFIVFILLFEVAPSVCETKNCKGGGMAVRIEKVPICLIDHRTESKTNYLPAHVLKHRVSYSWTLDPHNQLQT